MKLIFLDICVAAGKSACRRLFSRSHTVASIDQSKCSDHEENETNLPNGSTEGMFDWLVFWKDFFECTFFHKLFP